jgi:hypothetical protein
MYCNESKPDELKEVAAGDMATRPISPKERCPGRVPLRRVPVLRSERPDLGLDVLREPYSTRIHADLALRGATR